MVEMSKVSRNIIEAYAAAIRPTDSAFVVSQANAFRSEADPGDPDVTTIRLINLPPPGTVPPYVFWSDVFSEACLNGPRMLAALLLVVKDTQFSAGTKADRQELLDYLRRIA
jgi:hypothetical protein